MDEFLQGGLKGLSLFDLALRTILRQEDDYTNGDEDYESNTGEAGDGAGGGTGEWSRQSSEE